MVIAILASITIVSYNGIQKRAQVAAVSLALGQASKKLALYAVDNGTYPVDLATAGLTNGGAISYQYGVNNGSTSSYCLAATNGSTSAITDQTSMQSPGGNNMFQKSATMVNYASGTDNGNPVATFTADAIGGDYQTFTNTNGGNRYWYPITTDGRTQGATYTISLEVNTTTAGWGGYWYPSENYANLSFPNTGGSWQRWSLTYTQTGANSTGNKLFGFRHATAGNSINFRKLKLEIGNVSNCWVSEQ